MSKYIPPKSDEWLSSKAIDAIVKAVQTVKNETPKRTEFRVSGLPYCPLLDLVDRKSVEPAHEEYESSFFFHVGTALHELFQKFARDAKGVALVGNWKCTKVISTKYDNNPPSETVTRCSHEYEFCEHADVQKKHSCPHKLKECSADLFQYVEITLTYNGLSGHIDLIFKINGKYILVDIKTTSSYLFDYPDKAIERGWYPSLKYWEQVETYSVLIEKLKDIKIDSYAILYISRDHTSNKKKGHMIFARKLTSEMRKGRLKRLEKQIKNNELAQKYLKKPNSKTLKVIWENRPCQTKKDYKHQMAYKFFNETCQFHKDGSCYSGKIINKIEKLYKNEKGT